MRLRRLLRTTGPLPPSVYWMRRGAVLLIGVGVLVLVLVLILRAIPSGRTAGVATAPSTPPATVLATSSSASTPATTATTPATTPDSTTTTAALPACTAAELTVTVTTSAGSYPAGIDPVLSATVRATSPCTATEPVFVVTSGRERIWGSADCAKVAAVTITPGYHRTVRWDRTRSEPGCATVVGTTTATTGTYHVVATVAGASSSDVRFDLD